MTRIVVNQSLKFLQKNEKLDFISYEWDVPENTDEEEPELENVPTSVIQELIRQLPTGYRMVFNLYVFQNKSHKEIASILNIKESTSASQFHRAKDVLIKQIKQYKSISQWKKNG